MTSQSCCDNEPPKSSLQDKVVVIENNTSMMIPTCRICFESDEESSKLISPCDCRGSSLHIHRHCLEQWQENAISRHNPMLAMSCPTCLSPYRSAHILPWISTHFWSKWKSHCVEYVLDAFSFLNAIILAPMQFFFHATLFIAMVPLKRFGVHAKEGLISAAMKFSPQWFHLYSSPPILIPGLRTGCLLVASSRSISSEDTISTPQRSVILVLEHSLVEGTVGIVINHKDVGYLPTISSPNLMNLYGGPVDDQDIAILHQVPQCSLHCQPIRNTTSRQDKADADVLYVAKNEKAFITIQLLASAMRQTKTLDEENQAHMTKPIYLSRGSCQWLPNQLEAEIQAGLWHVMNADVSNILYRSHFLEEDIWQLLQSRLPPDESNP